MPEFRDFVRGESVALAGRVYELVYTSGFGLPFFPPDRATFSFVLGGRPEVAVRRIRTDPIDGEIHAFVHVNETQAFETIFPLQISVVPEDSWFAPVSAVANLAGVSSFSELDRWREVGTAESFDASQEAEAGITEELDDPNVRNVVSDLSERIQGIGFGISIVGIAALALIISIIRD